MFKIVRRNWVKKGEEEEEEERKGGAGLFVVCFVYLKGHCYFFYQEILS